MAVKRSRAHEVREVDERIEVLGYSELEVRQAMELFQAVRTEQVSTRKDFRAQVHEAMVRNHIPLVSQASQSQALRRSALRAQLLEDQGYETYSSLAEKRQTRESSARTWVARERQRGSLFTVKLQGTTIIPKVQLTEDGQLHEPVTRLVSTLRAAHMDGWSLWAWLCSPTGLLSGDVPAQVAETNQGRAHKAATRIGAELKSTHTRVS